MCPLGSLGGAASLFAQLFIFGFALGRLGALASRALSRAGPVQAAAGGRALLATEQGLGFQAIEGAVQARRVGPVLVLGEERARRGIKQTRDLGVWLPKQRFGQLVLGFVFLGEAEFQLQFRQ